MQTRPVVEYDTVRIALLHFPSSVWQSVSFTARVEVTVETRFISACSPALAVARFCHAVRVEARLLPRTRAKLRVAVEPRVLRAGICTTNARLAVFLIAIPVFTRGCRKTNACQCHVTLAALAFFRIVPTGLDKLLLKSFVPCHVHLPHRIRTHESLYPPSHCSNSSMAG